MTIGTVELVVLVNAIVVALALVLYRAARPVEIFVTDFLSRMPDPAAEAAERERLAVQADYNARMKLPKTYAHDEVGAKIAQQQHVVHTEEAR